MSTKGPTIELQAVPYALFPSTRFFCIVLLFFVVAVDNICYCVFNFTLICMVNSTTDQVNSSSGESHYRGDIDWTLETRSNVLAAYSLGTLLSIPVGALVDKYGARCTLTVSLAANSIALVLTPTVAYLGEWYIFCLRLLIGIVGGAFWPSIMAVTVRWVAASETSFMAAIGQSGFSFGNLFAYFSSGVFCDLGAHGWMLAYYVGAGLSVVMAAVFWVLYRDNPTTHRFISDRELTYIMSNRSFNSKKEQESKSTASKTEYKIPYVDMLKSGPLFATVTSNITVGWIISLVCVFVPKYMKEVLQFGPASNGLFAALPTFGTLLGRPFWGFTCDRIQRCRLDPTILVKVFETFSLGVPALCFVAIALLRPEHAQLSIVFFILSLFAMSATTGGNIRSSILIAPRFVGLTASIAEVTYAMSCILVPYFVNFLTPHGNIEEWRLVFYLSAAVASAGVLNFLIFGSGKLQSWAEEKAPCHDEPMKRF